MLIHVEYIGGNGAESIEREYYYIVKKKKKKFMYVPFIPLMDLDKRHVANKHSRAVIFFILKNKHYLIKKITLLSSSQIHMFLLCMHDRPSSPSPSLRPPSIVFVETTCIHIIAFFFKAVSLCIITFYKLMFFGGCYEEITRRLVELNFQLIDLNNKG